MEPSCHRYTSRFRIAPLMCEERNRTYDQEGSRKNHESYYGAYSRDIYNLLFGIVNFPLTRWWKFNRYRFSSIPRS